MKALIASALLTISLSAHAGSTFFISGNKLLEWCENERLSPMCYGYVVGVADSKMKHCPMPGVTVKQMGNTVIKYAKMMPENLHGPADVLVHAILSYAFNCEIENKKDGALRMM
jgi:hypothetical protein